MKKDFLSLKDFERGTYEGILERAAECKRRRSEGLVETTLAGKTLVLIFEKSSTRTRLSFEAAMFQLGGHAITLPWSESQAAAGEPLSDTGRVTSRYADAIVFRTFGEERLLELAQASTCPVINALTDQGHPVQVLTDVFTILERFGSLEGREVAWIGDGSGNMARSWAEAASIFGIRLRLASPAGYELPAAFHSQATHLVSSPEEAVAGAEVVMTDVWTSMGMEAERERRLRDFHGYTVDERLLSHASPDSIVLHCLPARRGEEITDAVMASPRSAIWDQAENRLHVQKALLEHLLLSR